MNETKTVVIDTISGMQELCREYVLKTYCGGDQTRFDSYGRGWIQVLMEWRRMLVLYDQLRAKGVMTLLLSHADQRPSSDPLQPELQTWVPLLNKKVWLATSMWADAVLFPMCAVHADEGRVRATARVMRCDFGPPACCKNRWGLTGDIALGDNAAESWALLVDAIRGARERAIKNGAGNSDELRKPPRIVIYGEAGSGKTSMAGHAPAPLFINDPRDEGVITLHAYGQVPAGVKWNPSPTTWTEFLSQLQAIVKES